MMTPLGISIMINAYGSPDRSADDFDKISKARSYDEEINVLISEGMVIVEEGRDDIATKTRLVVTRKGEAYVRTLCRVSLPEVHYSCHIEPEHPSSALMG